MVRVLVIEDDPSVRRVLRFCLRDAGFDIAETTSGAEAVQSLDAAPTEAVILDLGLVDDLAGAVLDRLRRPQVNGHDAGPAWVVVSALDLEEAIRRYGPMDNHFLRKPFDPWILLSMLQRLMAEKDNS